MTRPLFTLVFSCAAAVLATTVATAPVGSSGARLMPISPPYSASTTDGTFDVRVGDGIVQVRIRGCGTCRTLVTIEIKLPQIRADAEALRETCASRDDLGL